MQKPRSISAMPNESVLEASSICHNQSSINCQIPQSNENSLFVKRRSNSTLDSYFREKFGTNAEDVTFYFILGRSSWEKIASNKGLKKVTIDCK